MPSDNIFTIEKLKEEIASSLPGLGSNAGLKLLTAFYELVLSSENELIIDAYSAEFINDFLLSAQRYSPRFQHPDSANSFLHLVQRLKAIKNLTPYRSRLNELEQTVAAENEKFISFLNGTQHLIGSSGLYFPVLGEITFGNTKIPYSAIEEIRIKILPAREKDSFLFVPAGKGNEQLIAQAKTSFGLALNYIKRYKKGPLRKHEVILFFENYLAEYSGDSLGTALTIGFIQELTRFYNLPYIVSTEPGIATTGGIKESGIILPVGANSIDFKVETLFYSELSSLVIPKEDEPAAHAKLDKLRALFPNRNLRLISAESFDDLLERRSLIEIKKQNSVVRLSNYLLRNWMMLIIIIFFTIIASFYLFVQQENNPSSIDVTNYGYIVKNKTGQILWTLQQDLSKEFLGFNYRSIDCFTRIIDFDKDGKNEVLYAFYPNSVYSDDKYSQGIAVFNYDGKIRYKIGFNRTVQSEREFLPPPYGLCLYDTLTYNGKTSIIIGADNGGSYASALFIWDLNAQKSISDTLWNCGHLDDVRIADLNNDGRRKVLLAGQNNAFKMPQFAILELSNFKGQIPSNNEYQLYGIPPQNDIKLFLFAPNDLSKYKYTNVSGFTKRGVELYPNESTIRLILLNGPFLERIHLIYNFLFNKNDFQIHISNEFRTIRDPLVKSEFLKTPYTDTKEYRETLRKEIKAWNGKEFVDYYTYKKTN